MESIHLYGAEIVREAGRTIAAAASDMRSAVSSLDDTLHRHRLFLDDWLDRFTMQVDRIVAPATGRSRGCGFPIGNGGHCQMPAGHEEPCG